MEEPTMKWQELVDWSRDHDLLAMRLYVVQSEPTHGLGPVLENLDVHVDYQKDVERRGIMFGAGPFASVDGTEWNGAGMFIYRADSIEQAITLAEADPMHKAGARSFSVREWMLNEGTYSVQVFYTGGKAIVT